MDNSTLASQEAPSHTTDGLAGSAIIAPSAGEGQVEKIVTRLRLQGA